MEMDVDMDEMEGTDIIVEMVNGSVRSLVCRYLASRAIEEGLEMEVEEELEVEVVDDNRDEDEGDLVVEVDEDEGLLADMEELELDEYLEMSTWRWVPLTQTWSSGDASVEALMEEDALAHFSEGEQYIFSVEELMDHDDAAERLQ